MASSSQSGIQDRLIQIFLGLQTQEVRTTIQHDLLGPNRLSCSSGVIWIECEHDGVARSLEKQIDQAVMAEYGIDTICQGPTHNRYREQIRNAVCTSSTTVSVRISPADTLSGYCLEIAGDQRLRIPLLNIYRHKISQLAQREASANLALPSQLPELLFLERDLTRSGLSE